MLTRQMREGFLTGRYDGYLPAGNRRSFQAGRIRKITCGSACGRGKTRVSFNLQANEFRFSVHSLAFAAPRYS